MTEAEKVGGISADGDEKEAEKMVEGAKVDDEDANGAAEKADAVKGAEGEATAEVKAGDDAVADVKADDAGATADEKADAEASADVKGEGEEPSAEDVIIGGKGEATAAEGPDEAAPKPPDASAKSAAEAIESDLGVAAKAHFEFAVPLVTKAPNLEKLEVATERLVKALRAAPEEKSTTRGYGELALLYGRALLGFVIRGAAEGDVLGGKAKAGDEEDVEEKKEEGAQEEGAQEEEKEDTTEELCWTQLEVARLAFQKCGPKERLCVAVRTIGEFLLACDQASAAGEEFGSAAGMCAGREKAECLYKRYLSLRRVSVDEAKKSLREAIEVMKTIDGTAEVVKEMSGELQALPGGEEGKGAKRAADVTVTRVTPKRRK